MKTIKIVNNIGKWVEGKYLISMKVEPLEISFDGLPLSSQSFLVGNNRSMGFIYEIVDNKCKIDSKYIKDGELCLCIENRNNDIIESVINVEKLIISSVKSKYSAISEIEQFKEEIEEFKLIIKEHDEAINLRLDEFEKSINEDIQKLKDASII